MNAPMPPYTDEQIAQMIAPGEQYTRWFPKFECEDRWRDGSSIQAHVDPKTPDCPVELRVENIVIEDDGPPEFEAMFDIRLTPEQAELLAAQLITGAELSRRFVAALVAPETTPCGT